MMTRKFPTINVFAVLLLLLALYSAYLILGQVGEISQSFQSFFDHSAVLAILATSIVVLAPISVLALAYLVNRNQRKYVVLLPASHAAIVLPGMLGIIVVSIILVWWFSRYAAPAK